jgi:ribosomal protein S18 acetylase RimI-like enzyme
MATSSDLIGVQELLRATWHDTYDALLGSVRVAEMTAVWHSIDALKQEIERPHASFLVALVRSELVGHAFAEERACGLLFLSRLYVLPQYQRQGIGKSLLATVMQLHPSSSHVELIVEKRNLPASTFYSGHGFAVVDEIVEEGSTPVRMVKHRRPQSLHSS